MASCENDKLGSVRTKKNTFIKLAVTFSETTSLKKSESRPPHNSHYVFVQQRALLLRNRTNFSAGKVIWVHERYTAKWYLIIILYSLIEGKTEYYYGSDGIHLVLVLISCNAVASRESTHNSWPHVHEKSTCCAAFIAIFKGHGDNLMMRSPTKDVILLYIV